jgi:uncharacterized membrane-anchored protein
LTFIVIVLFCSCNSTEKTDQPNVKNYIDTRYTDLSDEDLRLLINQKIDKIFKEQKTTGVTHRIGDDQMKLVEEIGRLQLALNEVNNRNTNRTTRVTLTLALFSLLTSLISMTFVFISVRFSRKSERGKIIVLNEILEQLIKKTRTTRNKKLKSN